MKPIDATKIIQTTKPSAHAQSAEHNRVAAAYLARIFTDGDMTDRAALYQWGTMTFHSGAMGGYGEGRFATWIAGQLDGLWKIQAAYEFASSPEGEQLAGGIPERREAAQADIESLEQTIAELQAALESKREELAGVEADCKRCRDAVAKINEAEDDTGGLNMLQQAWAFVKSGSHPFEPEKTKIK